VDALVVSSVDVLVVLSVDALVVSSEDALVLRSLSIPRPERGSIPIAPMETSDSLRWNSASDS
ncbi:hypothetical protein OAU96_03820, partial [Planctomycetota bacterium]|nr:hypothetical protein [Planctomycetota bacterium]